MRHTLATVRPRALSKSYRHFALPVAESKRLFITVCLLGAFCVSSSSHAEGEKVWSRGFSSEPANSIDRAREFVLFSVDQGELGLVGTWSYTNGVIKDETPSPIVIEGTRTADGSFWPDFRLEVRKGRKGKWKRIVTSPTSGERATVTIEPKAIKFDLMVKLDAFKPFLNEYGSGRIVLKTGRSSEFELKDLLPPESEVKSKDDSGRWHNPALHSNDSDIQKTEKARYARQRSGASKVPKRTLAFVNRPAESRLGSSIDAFRSAWGSPIREEMLVRTATLAWRAATQSNGEFPTGIFEAEVSFLDQIACGIVLRSKRPATPDKAIRLVQPVLPSFRAADFAKPRSDVNGIRVYDLEDGTSVSVKQHKGRMVIVIKGQCYLDNEAVFNGEAAKVRPPTSNH